MRIASWNVNSVRARLPNITGWLLQAEPDVVLLQELKCEDSAFPYLEFEALGYQAHVHGQKSYNGVAILSKLHVSNVRIGLPGDVEDTHARFIEANIGGVHVASIYLPNGNPIDSEKYTYKLNWMKRLAIHAASLYLQEKPVVLGGDFNVIPEPRDVYDPVAWQNDALFAQSTRKAFREILNLGYSDALRILHPDAMHAYTFWDYQAGAWPRDNGLRIDHFLLSPEAADCLQAIEIDKQPRGMEKASDHTPIMATFLV